MDADDDALEVGADDYRSTSADVVLGAQLQSSLAVCLYDESEPEGALLHLRLAAPGQSRDPDLTDNTLSGDLALLDRALRELTGANPRAQHWRARLVAHSEDQQSARDRCEALQAFIVALLQDAGVEVVGSTVHVAAAVCVRFRPAMGQVRTATSAAAPARRARAT
jgi:chemotaxis receptor (MCP) glutamine deamidase CheD